MFKSKHPLINAVWTDNTTTLQKVQITPVSVVWLRQRLKYASRKQWNQEIRQSSEPCLWWHKSYTSSSHFLIVECTFFINKGSMTRMKILAARAKLKPLLERGSGETFRCFSVAFFKSQHFEHSSKRKVNVVGFFPFLFLLPPTFHTY